LFEICTHEDKCQANKALKSSPGPHSPPQAAAITRKEILFSKLATRNLTSTRVHKNITDEALLLETIKTPSLVIWRLLFLFPFFKGPAPVAY
jgi:hypothetical protein